MEDNLFFSGNLRTTLIFHHGRQFNLLLWEMEEDIYILVIGVGPQYFGIWKTVSIVW